MAQERAAARVHPEVEAYFESDPEGEMEVLLVLDTPQPDLTSMMAPKVDWKSAGAGLPDPRAVAAIVDRVRDVLSELDLAGNARWLANAHSFVVRLDGPQLKVIRQHRDVLEILPNASLK